MESPSITNPKSSKSRSKKHALRLFWRFGAEFHDGEAVRHDATDFAIFTVMALVCAWPIASAAFAIVHVYLG